MDVSAFLSTSATINGVAEAFVVLENSGVVVSVPYEPSADRAAFDAMLDGDPAAQQPTVTARVPAVLADLASLGRGSVDRYLSNHADAVAELIAAPPAASVVSGWWAMTDASTRAELALAAPQLVGNLEGLPYSVRAVANERSLDSTRTALEGQLVSAGRAAADDIRDQLHMLAQIEQALQPTAAERKAGLTRELIAFDPTDGGRAVIAIGDLETADYVSYLVPGMFYSVDSELVSWTNAAAELAIDQQRWLARLAVNQTATVATVAWIGYQTPTLVDVASLDLAREGSVALADSVRGLQTLRGDDAPYLSILTHSYGSTVALLAVDKAQLGDDAITVDALAMVGSPGSPAKTVGALSVRGGNVWVADAVLDPVANTGVFGSQPLSAKYGAHAFGVSGVDDPLTGEALAGSVGHVDYFTAGSESFRNLALISLGRSGFVLDQDGQLGASAAARARGLT